MEIVVMMKDVIQSSSTPRAYVGFRLLGAFGYHPEVVVG